MKTKIYLVSFTSFTQNDNYLYQDINTYTDEQQAQEQWNKLCQQAYEECHWGSEYDSQDKAGAYEYEVDEERDPGTYTVSSEAYEGYKVQVCIEEKVMDVSVPPVVRANKTLPAIYFNQFDLRELNGQYQEILERHQNDTDVTGRSRESFIKALADDIDDNLFAMAYNSWDELCSLHDGLADSGLDWFCGASFVGYCNEWDLYIGTGDETN